MKKTMSDLIRERKSLERQIKNNPALAEQLKPQIAEINEKLSARVEKNDQNFLRVFYKHARQGLPDEVFKRIEDISSTRHNDQVKKN